MDYPGFDGFLGTRASLMLDVVFLAMFAVIPVLAASIYLVRVKRNFAAHKRLQLGLGIVLALAVTLFEIDIRVNGWRERATASPYYDAELMYGLVNWSLWAHLVFAVTTTLLWIYVIVAALRKFPRAPSPAEHSRNHVFWGRAAAIDMTMTAISGWLFYYLAFVA